MKIVEAMLPNPIGLVLLLVGTDSIFAGEPVHVPALSQKCAIESY